MENLAAQAAKSRSEQAEKMVAQLEYQLQFLRLKAGEWHIIGAAVTKIDF